MAFAISYKMPFQLDAIAALAGRTGGKRLLRIALLAAAAPLCAGTAAALPAAESFEYFGLSYAIYVQTSTAFGVLNYDDGPGCGGICTATTTLTGPTGPSVSLTVNEVEFDGGGGGYAGAQINFYFQYDAAPGTYTLNVNAADMLAPVGVGTAQAYLGIGQAAIPVPDVPLTGIGDGGFSATPVFQDTDCATVTGRSEAGCSAGVANAYTPAALGLSQFSVVANTPYLVSMWVVIAPGTAGSPETATLDPLFTDDGQGGTFEFSDGITNEPTAVPEASPLAVMLVGVLGLGVLYRARRAA